MDRNAKSLEIGSRVQLNDDLATIKYIGEIPNWPHIKAYGLEWDTATRGKNNGTLNDVFYFETSDGCESGSFIKESKLIKDGGFKSRTFWDALCYQYGGTKANSDEEDGLEDKFDLMIGSKKVQSFGFGKLTRLQSNFKNLKVISLNRLSIGNQVGSTNLSECLTNLKALDLGFNLINDWKMVMDVVCQISELEILTVNGNRFNRVTNPDNKETQLRVGIRKLYFASCGLEYCDMKLIEGMLLRNFPSLELLSVAGNGLKGLTKLEKPLIQLRFLNNLDLSFNELSNIEYQTLSQIPALTHLNLSNNRIQVTKSKSRLETIEWMDVSNNNISEWFEIDNICQQFPNLKSIKITGNPLFSEGEETGDLHKNDIDLVQLISRLPHVSKLNGTDYSMEQRANYELYFINKVKYGEWKYDKESTVWKRLCHKYGIPLTSKSTTVDDSEPTNTSHSIVIRIKDDPNSNKNQPFFRQLVFPSSTTVGKLRGKISKRLGISVLNFQVYFKAGKSLLEEQIEEKLGNDQQLLEIFQFKDNSVVYVRREAWVI